MKSDEGYTGESIDFDITIQDYLKAGGWGVSIYKISSINKEAEIELVQRK